MKWFERLLKWLERLMWWRQEEEVPPSKELVECEKCHVMFPPHGLKDFPENWCLVDIERARKKREALKTAADKRKLERRNQRRLKRRRAK